MTPSLSKVLVTGADGFVGSHLVDALLALGCEVTAVVRRTSRSQVTHDFPNLAHCIDNKQLTIVSVDLAGASAESVLSDLTVETWMHLAADAYVSASLTQPASVVENNVRSTVAVLEAARRRSIPNVIVTSSSEVYGGSPHPISEDSPLEPATPYAASKTAADRIAYSYWRTYRMPVTIVRPFNCYGPRHSYDVVPTFIRLALRGEPLRIHGDGLQTRDLTYVSDLVDAFIRVASRPAPGRVFNVGTGNDISVKEMARQVIAATGSKSEIVHAPERPGDLRRLCADASRIKSELGWRPLVPFEAGLQRNVEWFRSRVS